VSSTLQETCQEERVAERRKKGPGGRPPKPRAHKQAHRVALSLTEWELRALRRAAGSEGLATYARRVLLAHLEREGWQR